MCQIQIFEIQPEPDMLDRVMAHLLLCTLMMCMQCANVSNLIWVVVIGRVSYLIFISM